MHHCWVTRTNRNVWVTKDCHQLEKSRQAWGSATQSTTGWDVQEGDLAEIQSRWGKKQQRKDSRWLNHMRNLNPLWRSLSRDYPQIAEWGMIGLNLVYALVKLSDSRQDLEQNSCQGATQKFYKLSWQRTATEGSESKEGCLSKLHKSLPMARNMEPCKLWREITF